ncbi:pol-like protein [Colletotrichum musicola]|uniref:Pol-like protein n=1 Tax=Colletotrichum musicola TaxID=2175873 RepID=A0A8H6IQV2_9PEZI|nr:pol-like protein [Colletotrichum musicola]
MSFQVPDSPTSTHLSEPRESQSLETGMSDPAPTSLEGSEAFQATNLIASLSAEQKNQLLALLGSAPARSEDFVLRPQAAKKLQPWPEWSGKAESFRVYFMLLKAKIEADRQDLGNEATICYSILRTLPEDKRQRVSYWVERGGDDGKFNVNTFLDLVKNKFEDKESAQKAGKRLHSMRMGSSQLFRDFLDDFEYQLQQCNGLGWHDASKIVILRPTLNDKLARALVPVDLDETNYDRFVEQIGRVAARLEAMSSYRTDSRTRTWFSKEASSTHPAPTKVSSQVREGNWELPHTTARVDSDGDVRMTDAAQVAIELANLSRTVAKLSKTGARNSQPASAGAERPRAKWITEEEKAELSRKGKCFRSLFSPSQWPTSTRP